MKGDHDHAFRLPDDALPALVELPGDMRRVAEIIRPFMASDRAAVQAIFLLSSEFRGTNIYCRGLEEWRRTWRDRQIRAEYDRGDKVPEIARRWELSERWVWDILGRLPEADNQLKLW